MCWVKTFRGSGWEWVVVMFTSCGCHGTLLAFPPFLLYSPVWWCQHHCQYSPQKLSHHHHLLQSHPRHNQWHLKYWVSIKNNLQTITAFRTFEKERFKKINRFFYLCIWISNFKYNLWRLTALQAHGLWYWPKYYNIQ